MIEVSKIIDNYIQAIEKSEKLKEEKKKLTKDEQSEIKDSIQKEIDAYGNFVAQVNNNLPTIKEFIEYIINLEKNKDKLKFKLFEDLCVQAKKNQQVFKEIMENISNLNIDKDKLVSNLLEKSSLKALYKGMWDQLEDYYEIIKKLNDKFSYPKEAIWLTLNINYSLYPRDNWSAKENWAILNLLKYYDHNKMDEELISWVSAILKKNNDVEKFTELENYCIEVIDQNRTVGFAILDSLFNKEKSTKSDWIIKIMNLTDKLEESKNQLSKEKDELNTLKNHFNEINTANEQLNSSFTKLKREINDKEIRINDLSKQVQLDIQLMDSQELGHRTRLQQIQDAYAKISDEYDNVLNEYMNLKDRTSNITEELDICKSDLAVKTSEYEKLSREVNEEIEREKRKVVNNFCNTITPKIGDLEAVRTHILKCEETKTQKKARTIEKTISDLEGLFKSYGLEKLYDVNDEVPFNREYQTCDEDAENEEIVRVINIGWKDKNTGKVMLKAEVEKE